MTPSDPRYYYLANFERALAWLAQRYEDLLSPDESAFLTHFADLPLPARALLVRMLMRRGDLFRTSRLNYDEIGDNDVAIGPLAALGWVDREPLLPLDTLFALMTKPELVDIFGRPPTPSTRKSAWLEHLSSTFPDARAYRSWHGGATDEVVHVTIGPLCERLRLMFFGNLYQDWSEFVLADLGIFQYESVAFDTASRAFQRREDIDTYLQIQACRAALELGPDLDLAALFEAAESARSDNPWIETRRAKLLFQIGQYCERLQQFDHAREAYERSAYPGARHRLIRVLERSELIERAWPLALEAVAAPESDEELQRVSRMMPRLKRLLAKAMNACGIQAIDLSSGNTFPAHGSASQRRDDASISSALATGSATAKSSLASVSGLTSIASEKPESHELARTPIRRIDVTLARPSDGERVEWAALAHLHRDDAPVHYVENTLINGLFGLLCWPAIFEPLPGAFFHPFQSGPADLHAPDFASRRLASFSACFAALDNGTYRQIILDRFNEKFGLQSPFVAWNALDTDLLTLALDCIPAHDLKRFFERVLADVKANRSGLPDLIQFWPSERRYALIEIKGPGDRLQDNQLRWIDYCAQHGIPIDVMHVRWQDDNDLDNDDEEDPSVSVAPKEAHGPDVLDKPPSLNNAENPDHAANAETEHLARRRTR